MSEPTRADVFAQLDSLPVPQAVDRVLGAISAAVEARDFESVGGLLVVMCRYDPHKADDVRRKLLDACNGRITLTVDLREAVQIAAHPREGATT